MQKLLNFYSNFMPLCVLLTGWMITCFLMSLYYNILKEETSGILYSLCNNFIVSVCILSKCSAESVVSIFRLYLQFYHRFYNFCI